VPHNQLPDLSYLIRLGMAPIALQIYSFSNTFLPENVMTSPHTLSESQAD
jgi:hypothetical protein